MSDVQVFPVRLKFSKDKNKWEKLPAVPKGTHWNDWRGGIEGAKNYGLVVPVGKIIIDLDTRKGVTREQVEKVLGCRLDWDDALLQRTVSGGEHYMFSVPDSLVFRQGDSLLGVQGFDTRCSGRGWICCGEKYEDETLIGLPEAVSQQRWPELPPAAVEKLSGSDTVENDDLLALVNQADKDDLNIEEMRFVLDSFPAENIDTYSFWLKIGMALHHQTDSSEEGLQLWKDISSKSKHYDEAEIEKKWTSFGRNKQLEPVRFRSLIKEAGGREVVTAGRFIALKRKAAEISDVMEYDKFCKAVADLSISDLPEHFREMLASSIMKSFGKSEGLTKATVKKNLAIKKRERRSEFDTPEWLEPWVYIQSTCFFANTEDGRKIKREAFNQTYDREKECFDWEVSASQLASTKCPIPVVYDSMFYPGADRLFNLNGHDYLNDFRDSGVEPVEIDDKGREAIALLQQHLDFLIEEKREQAILLDWMTYAIQNPGARINWAILLQGGQGVGKSYFTSLLKLILGEHVRSLEPAAITGRFTGWAYGSLVTCIEEIRFAGQSKYEILDRLKPFITNPSIQIEEKGRDHRTVPNFTNYIMLTNYKDAIPIDDSDRRYCVIFSRIQSEEELNAELGGKDAAEDYFTRLFSMTEENAGAISTWFRNRKISTSFKPSGRAPDTVAKRMMCDATVSTDRTEIEDAIGKYECYIVNENIINITWLNKRIAGDGGELPKKRSLSAVLFDMKYQPIDGRRIKIKNEHHYIWRKSKISDEEAVSRVREYFKDSEEDDDFSSGLTNLDEPSF